MHYVKSGDKRRRGQLENLGQSNAENVSLHLKKLPVKIVLVCVCARVCVTTHFLLC